MALQGCDWLGSYNYIASITREWNKTTEGYRVKTEIDFVGAPGLFTNIGDIHITACPISECATPGNGAFVPGKAVPAKGQLWRTGGEYKTTAAHEFGHLLGLGHHYSSPSIMGYGQNNPSRTVTAGDLARLSRLY